MAGKTKHKLVHISCSTFTVAEAVALWKYFSPLSPSWSLLLLLLSLFAEVTTSFHLSSHRFSEMKMIQSQVQLQEASVFKHSSSSGSVLRQGFGGRGRKRGSIIWSHFKRQLLSHAWSSRLESSLRKVTSIKQKEISQLEIIKWKVKMPDLSCWYLIFRTNSTVVSVQIKCDEGGINQIPRANSSCRQLHLFKYALCQDTACVISGQFVTFPKTSVSIKGGLYFPAPCADGELNLLNTIGLSDVQYKLWVFKQKTEYSILHLKYFHVKLASEQFSDHYNWKLILVSFLGHHTHDVWMSNQNKHFLNIWVKDSKRCFGCKTQSELFFFPHLATFNPETMP